MPDLKISQLTDGSPISDSDEFVIARSGSSFKILGSEIHFIFTVISTSSLIYNSNFLEVIKIDASSNNVTVNLPTAVSNSGKSIIAKRMDSSSNTVTINSNSGEKIDDELTKVLTSQYSALHMMSDGANLIIL